MNPLDAWRALGLAGRLIAVIIALGLLLGVSWWLMGGVRRDALQTKVGAALGEARGKSAGEAVNIVAAGADRDAATDAQTRENDHEIRTAPGAGQAVDPGVHGAGLGGLCERPAYRCSAQCLQLARARQLPDPCPRR